MESDSKSLRFSNLAAACGILDNSKFLLVRTQYLLNKLYSGQNMVLAYGDTDSCYIAVRHPESLEANERKDLTPEERADLRFQLFGSEAGRNFAKCKIECKADSITVLAPKCYFLTDTDPESSERKLKCARFKGSSTAAKMPLAELEMLGRRETLMRERTVRMGRTSFGVRLPLLCRHPLLSNITLVSIPDVPCVG